MTMSKNHPDGTRLAAYLESIRSNEFQDVRRHLAACVPCRRNVTALQTVGKGLKHFPPVWIRRPAGEHPNELAIADYVEGRLPSDQLAEIKQHVMGCAFCTKAALHYATHSAETKRAGAPGFETETLHPTLQKVEEKSGHANVERPGFFTWRMPVWFGVPGTALATAAIILLLNTLGYRESSSIVSYQDNPEVVFDVPKGSPPGIGFFGSARQRAEHFEGIIIRREDDQHFRLKWPEIKTARIYEIKVYSSSDEGRALVGQTSASKKREVLLQVSGILPGKRYEWELSGKTVDDGNFLARGGFIVGEEARF